MMPACVLLWLACDSFPQYYKNNILMIAASVQTNEKIVAASWAFEIQSC
jgi:hypothetical protein